ILCYMLAKYAVHAAMAGRTGCVIGNENSVFSHVPVMLATLTAFIAAATFAWGFL
ncbi:MAG: hypothetical protein RLZZ604_1051, partial [Pseudomonadota bacterium]